MQTILPRYIAKNTPDYHRTLLKDSLAQSDVAFDYVMADDQKGADGRYTTPIVVLFHGMEGSSQSHYARTLASHISTKGWHFVVAHFRSCGGVAVSGKVFYNAGDAAELAHYLQVLQQQFTTIYAIGVSLGGNALAKYMGEYGSGCHCKSCRGCLCTCGFGKCIYCHGTPAWSVYLHALSTQSHYQKALDNRLSSEEIAALKSAKRMADFDNAFTAPRHGFAQK